MTRRNAERGTQNGVATIPVLCYHRIGGARELGVTRVSARVFRRHMDTLARDGWRTLTLSEYCSALRVPRLAFLLTFDDAYASLADYAYPVLADLGFTATTFVITDFVGRENTWDMRYTWRRQRHLDWDTIATWQARGFDFGSHTATHPRLTWLDDALVADELGRSRATLVDRLGTDAGCAVAYPFGASNERIRTLAEAAGYALGFGLFGNGGPLAIGRVPVYAWDRLGTPCGLRGDAIGRIGVGAAYLANRCAVGTSVIKRLLPRAAPSLAPAAPGSVAVHAPSRSHEGGLV